MDIVRLIQDAIETNAESLDLSNRHITELPAAISRFTGVSIDLSGNKLTALPKEIGDMANLTGLYLSGNIGLELPKEISSLHELAWLDLAGMGMTEVPTAVFALKQLMCLDLSGNQIKALPADLVQFQNLQHLYLGDNPIDEPPLEVLNLDSSGRADLENIRAYFRQTAEGTDRLYEAKLLIVGEPGAGKTSLARKIEDPAYPVPQEQKSTEGIEVIPWKFRMADGTEFRVNIWDFGGQEIYKDTHQFFLTKRSLYLLVADMRREDTDFNYWLNIVEMLSDGSPVLIVQNKNQDREREIDEQTLRGLFGSLEKTLPTNLATNEGLTAISDAIKFHISQLPHVGASLPKTWVKVREALERDTRNYIGLDEYLDICRRNGFKDRADSLQLSDYLHDLGICLHFQYDPVLRNTIILKPKWGTDAVYKVLDNRTVALNFGKFDKNNLAAIWNDAEYEGMDHELLQLMVNFKLCYRIPNTKDYIAPQLLTGKQPQYDWDERDNLILRYEYTFMPKGILTQLIVAMHEWIVSQDWVWKSGVILGQDGTRAEVVETYDLREIKIRIGGKHKKDLLVIITHEIDKIHATYRRLKCGKMIPCNCVECKGSQYPYFYPYEELRRFVEKGLPDKQCGSSGEMVNVRGLIDDVIDTAEFRHKLEGHVGNQFNFYGPVGAAGENVHVDTVDQRTQSVDLNNLNFAALSAQLEQVRRAALEEASAPEHYRMIGDIKAAEDAAAKADKPALLTNLKAAGKWSLEVAEKVGAAALAKVIEHAMMGG
jgi:internalin A